MSADVFREILTWSAVGTAGLMAFFVWLLKTSIEKRLDADLTKLESGLRRVERLEKDVFQLRAQGYGEIWRLTGLLNLFGAQQLVDIVKLSNDLKDWYFEHGNVMKGETKKHYFLTQEALNFAMLRTLKFERPNNETLYASSDRTTKVLKKLREESLHLKMSAVKDEGVEILDQCVDAWKKCVNASEDRNQLAEKNWLLLQLLLSRLRTQLIRDLDI